MIYLLIFIKLSFSQIFIKERAYVNADVELVNQSVNGLMYEELNNYYLETRNSLVTKRNIVVLLRSNGGSLVSAVQIINLIENMKAQGYTFECHNMMTHSGASSIFQSCDKRIVYANTMYGQHRAGRLPSGACDFMCTQVDLLRLKQEAINIGTTPEELRETLPLVTENMVWVGKNILDSKLANKYIDKFIYFVPKFKKGNK